MNKPQTVTTASTLGDLINVLYEEYLAVYGDTELAAVATASTINEMIADEVAPAGVGIAAKADAA